MKKGAHLILLVFLVVLAIFVASLPVFAQIADSDRDGVPDKYDKCRYSNTILVDAAGCSCAQKNCPSDDNPCTDDCGTDNTRRVACRFSNNNNACPGGTCNNGQCVITRDIGGTGTLLGRIYRDGNSSGKWDTNELFIRDPTGISCANEFTQTGFGVNYNGPSSGSEKSNKCNPEPYYAVQLPSGRYKISVAMPDGWKLTSGNTEVVIEQNKPSHQWFGVVQAETPPECGPLISIASDTNTLADGKPSVAAWNQNEAWTANIPGATWIWKEYLVSNPSVTTTVAFTKTFTIPADATGIKGTFVVAADDLFKCYLNSDSNPFTPIPIQGVGYHQEQNKVTVDIGVYLKPGTNVLKCDVTNIGGDASGPWQATAENNPAGILYRLDITSSTCGNAICGNGAKEGAEECDDGNTIDGDGCSSSCKKGVPCNRCSVNYNYCYAHYYSSKQDCSDIVGTPAYTTDCSCFSGFKTESVSNCVPSSCFVCGNGRLEGSEECDDGNLINGDGCSTDCRTEGSATPDGINLIHAYQQPVIKWGQTSFHDSLGARDPWVIKDKNTFYLYYDCIEGLLNPSFESQMGTNGWDTWRATVTSSNEKSIFGSRSLKMVTDGTAAAGTFTGKYYYDNTKDLSHLASPTGLEVFPETEYIASAYFWASPGMVMGIVVQQYTGDPGDYNNNIIKDASGQPILFKQTLEGINSWQRIFVKFKVLPKSTAITLSFAANDAKPTTSYWDGVQLERVDTGVSSPSSFPANINFDRKLEDTIGWRSCVATSTDGIHFNKRGPLEVIGEKGAWEKFEKPGWVGSSFIYANVFKNQNRWYAYTWEAGQPVNSNALYADLRLQLPAGNSGSPARSGLAVADSPLGPFTRISQNGPVVVPRDPPSDAQSCNQQTRTSSTPWGCDYLTTIGVPASINNQWVLFLAGQTFKTKDNRGGSLGGESDSGVYAISPGYATASDPLGPWKVSTQSPIFTSQDIVKTGALEGPVYYYDKSSGIHVIFLNAVSGGAHSIEAFWTKNPLDKWSAQNTKTIIDWNNIPWTPDKKGSINLATVVEGTESNKLNLYFGAREGKYVQGEFSERNYLFHDIGLLTLQLPLFGSTVVCGNSVKEELEECDDGNQVNTDSCTNSCKNARCGDNYIRTGVEDCEGNNLNGQTCEKKGFASGTLKCYAAGTQNQCRFDTGGCSNPEPCTLQSASWQPVETPEGQQVKLIVQGQNCNSKQVNFQIQESDPIANDNVIPDPAPAVFSENRAESSWKAEWQDDGILGGNPEYVFTALSADSIIQSQNELVVTKSVNPQVCGNSNVDDGEACDGTNLNGNSCQSLGFSAGTLECSSCRINTQKCTTQPKLQSYDVVVVGAGTGGTAAAIQAARMGAKVALVEETDWIGGQATAGGVPNMDEGGLIRASGIYKEFAQRIKDYYGAKGKSVGTCYWASANICFEPSVGQQVLKEMIQETLNKELPDGKMPVLDVYLRNKVVNVLKSENKITGVVTQRGAAINGKVVIDATEYGDMLPLAGVKYRIGKSVSDSINQDDCIQDITYTAAITKYPNGIPAELQIRNPPPGYAERKTLFEKYVKKDGFNFGYGGVYSYPVSWQSHNVYRGIPDSSNSLSYTAGSLSEAAAITKTMVNWPNDYPSDAILGVYEPKLKVNYLEDKYHRRQINCEAKLKTLQFLYYIQKELNEDWSVAVEGYNTPYNNEENLCDNIPAEFKAIEKQFPLMPYVRESRRIIGIQTLTAKDMNRKTALSRPEKIFTSSLAMGDYGNDLHNCNEDSMLESSLEARADISAGSGPFQVPFEAFIPESVDGFVAAEKNIGTSRLGNGATRLQPVTMLTGQAAGAIAATAALKNIAPRNVDYRGVQDNLLDAGSLLYYYNDMPPVGEQFKAIQFTALKGIFSGYGDLSFKPNEPLKRNQAAIVLTKAFNIPLTNPAIPTFSDVLPSDLGYSAVEAFARDGFTSGCGQGKYCPQDSVSKVQTAVFLVRALHGKTFVPPAAQGIFSDVSISHWGAPWIEQIYKDGIMDSCAPNKFCPDDPATRGKMAVYLMKALKLNDIGKCGDGAVKKETEECDGTDLNGQSCEKKGFASGTLKCNAPGTAKQCKFDTSSCLQKIDLTEVDSNSKTGGATFQSHNQKVVQNQYGIFMTYLSDANDAQFNTWRLLRSQDGGKTFTKIFEETKVGTHAPPIESDSHGNVYAMRSESNYGLGWGNDMAYLFKFTPENNFANPAKFEIPGGASAKNTMILDEPRGQIYYFPYTPLNTFYIIGLDGAVKSKSQMLVAGTSASLQYPHLYLDNNGVLYAAWTTQVLGNVGGYWDIHFMLSRNGGITWEKPNGNKLTTPIVVDETGPTDRITLDDEFHLNPWLWSLTVKNGKAFFPYDVDFTKLQPPQPIRQHMTRYDLQTARIDKNIYPEWGGETIKLLDSDGFCASRNDIKEIYCASATGYSPYMLGVVYSDDLGETWHDYAKVSINYAGAYAIGGSRTITDDGYLIGSYTGVNVQPFVVKFFKVKVKTTPTNPVCGNNNIDSGEECDDGNQVNTDSCTNSCKNAKCGDLIVRNGVEDCDDGNTISGDGCSSVCKIEKCPDGTLLNQCSTTKPKLCSNGNLIDKASQCGCPAGFVVSGENCVLPCTLKSASWEKTQATEGEDVKLTVEGENCNGKQISFVVKEDDLAGDDDVVNEPLSVVFADNKATAVWKAEWQDDDILGGNPEYLFIASSPVSNELISENRLEVAKSLPSCAAPRITCQNACVDPRADSNNCGACGNRCSGTQKCQNGNCAAQSGLQYFGFYHVDTWIDDPFDAERKTNYVDEVKDFTNIADLASFEPWSSLKDRANLMINNQISPMIALHEVFFHNVGNINEVHQRYKIYADYQSRWSRFLQSAEGLDWNSVIFYLADEPFWNGISYDELKTAADLVKNTEATKNVPIAFFEAQPVLRNINHYGFQVPTSVDWIGFGIYGVTDPEQNPGFLNDLAIVKNARTRTGQKIFIAMDAQWNPGIHGGISESSLAQTATSTYDLAKSDEDIIAIYGFIWPGYENTKGARDLPQNVKDEYRRIGQLITGKTG